MTLEPFPIGDIRSIDRSKVLLLLIYTKSASPCGELLSILNKWSESPVFDAEVLQFYILDADLEENDSIIDKFNVNAVPTILIFGDGMCSAPIVTIEGFHPPKAQQSLFELTGLSFDLAGGSALLENGLSPEDNEHLNKLVNSHSLMVFIKGTPDRPQCGFTRQLVALFKENNITNYGHFDILSDDGVREKLKIYSDWPTYPQIHYKGELLGGLDIFKELAISDPELVASLGEQK